MIKWQLTVKIFPKFIRYSAINFALMNLILRAVSHKEAESQSGEQGLSHTTPSFTVN